MNKQEITQNDITVQEREQRQKELNEKIRELNKVGFVLQFKIRELKRTIKPKEQETAELGEKISEMNLELQRYRNNLAKLQSDKKDINNKNQSLNQQIQNS